MFYEFCPPSKQHYVDGLCLFWSSFVQCVMSVYYLCVKSVCIVLCCDCDVDVACRMSPTVTDADDPELDLPPPPPEIQENYYHTLPRHSIATIPVNGSILRRPVSTAGTLHTINYYHTLLCHSIATIPLNESILRRPVSTAGTLHTVSNWLTR